MPSYKQRIGKRILLVTLIIAMLAAIAYYISDRQYKPSFVQYKEFGIDLPADYSIHGIDVSRYQDEISWPDVRAMQVKNVRIGFAFIKATEGIDMVDQQFRRNMTETKKAGIPRGAYHFFIGSESGKMQAQNFIETVTLKPGDLPPVLDVETTNGASVADLQQRIADWLAVTEKKYGAKPLIYTNVDFYNNFLAGRFDNYPLWVAHYLAKDRPAISRSWSFWQHNEKGNVTGIRSHVDFNVFNGDSAAFRKLLLK